MCGYYKTCKAGDSRRRRRLTISTSTSLSVSGSLVQRYDHQPTQRSRDQSSIDAVALSVCVAKENEFSSRIIINRQ